MSIWVYEDQNLSDLASSYRDNCFIGSCPFCSTPMTHLAGVEFHGNASAWLGRGYKDYGKELRICPTCGWG